MSFDTLIRGGTIVDGTGRAAYVADLGIVDGRIAQIGEAGQNGRIEGRATTVIEARDRVVCPGFIDPHTHYDAQICWDEVLSPSCWHGVTTAIMGNCGVGLAPCPPERREMLLWDLTNVESIPMDVLRAGVRWDWESFPQYMDAAERRAKGINVGFYAPIAPFRHAVMGEESIERAANPEETARIAALLREAVAAGAMGFSSSAVKSHVGYKGRPFASRLTSHDEFRAYCRELRALRRGVIEIALLKIPGKIADDEYAMLELLLDESGRRITYTSVFARDDDPCAHLETLRRTEPLAARGALPQCTPKPLVSYLDMTNPINFSHFDCMRGLFNQPPETQIRIYSDPAFRRAFAGELAKASVAQPNWAYYEIQEVGRKDFKALEGLTVAAVAKQRGRGPLDTFFDLVVEDELRMRFAVTVLNGNDYGVAQIIGDPRAMIGLSDGGAHVDAMCDAAYPTFMLGKWVRERRLMTVERAVQRMTSEPADFFGIRDRGRLAEGLAADIVVFDPATVGSSDRAVPRHDLPGGARRMVVDPAGVDYSIVNGAVLFDHDHVTEARTGRVIRSVAD